LVSLLWQTHRQRLTKKFVIQPNFAVTSNMKSPPQKNKFVLVFHSKQSTIRTRLAFRAQFVTAVQKKCGAQWCFDNFGYL